MEALVKEELNIKSLSYVSDPDQYVSYEIKPNFPVLGPKYGKLMKGISKALAGCDTVSAVNKLRQEGQLELTIEDTPVVLTEEDLEIRTGEKQGYTVEMDRGNYVILDTKLTEDLIQEGLAREIVSKVQNMRKNAGFELTDRIELYYHTGKEVAAAIEAFKDYIMDETLAVSIVKLDQKTAELEEWEINGYPTGLKVEKI